MASSGKVNFIIFLGCILTSMVTSRPLTTKSTLAARLKLEDEPGSSNCWGSLFELQSCTGEVILFFLNGETYLGPSCCSAIKTIEHQCWPAMLGSLGFTTEEGDILRGYCDASNSTATPETLTTTPSISHAAIP
ncbi:hypothetical protein RJ640_012540 [Escallonia rubra]|uniref:Prolamin-like domain-containing protein n=1 Tax=Escallonia rubra TaxID=112253 RepID=A0AA88S972_9ASTE|nr:hypothetical protein RJ640_012540 [Escallonia rubra]